MNDVKSKLKNNSHRQTTPLSNRQNKPIRVPDLAYLERVAIWYLGRYSATSAMLQRVLMRRVERAVRAELIDHNAGQEMVTQIIRKCQEMGYIHDQNFAHNLTGRLARRGQSQRQIAASLRQRGLGAADIQNAIAQLDTEFEQNTEYSGNNSDATAYALADAMARRRHLGPYRRADLRAQSAEQRAQMRLRDLAILARAGHSGEIARRVIDNNSDDNDC